MSQPITPTLSTPGKPKPSSPPSSRTRSNRGTTKNIAFEKTEVTLGKEKEARELENSPNTLIAMTNNFLTFALTPSPIDLTCDANIDSPGSKDLRLRQIVRWLEHNKTKDTASYDIILRHLESCKIGTALIYGLATRGVGVEGEEQWPTSWDGKVTHLKGWTTSQSRVLVMGLSASERSEAVRKGEQAIQDRARAAENAQTNDDYQTLSSTTSHLEVFNGSNEAGQTPEPPATAVSDSAEPYQTRREVQKGIFPSVIDVQVQRAPQHFEAHVYDPRIRAEHRYPRIEQPQFMVDTLDPNWMPPAEWIAAYRVRHDARRRSERHARNRGLQIIWTDYGVIFEPIDPEVRERDEKQAADMGMQLTYGLEGAMFEHVEGTPKDDW